MDLDKDALKGYRRRLVKRMGFDPDHFELWFKKWYHLCQNANRRGNPVLLTFYQYLKLAREAELTSPDQIGNKPGLYQMGRLGDTGPYAIGNCRFITHEQNLLEQVANTGSEDLQARLRNWEKSRSGEEKKEFYANRQKAIMDSPNFREGRRKAAQAITGSSRPDVARPFRLVSPDGVVYTEGKITDLCAKFGLTVVNIYKVLGGSQGSHRGWTGTYTGPRGIKKE